MTGRNGDPAGPSVRVGHGYDLHRLEPAVPAGAGRPLVLGGLPFESPLGPVAHSDGDALLHAITDALLGALALDDLGTRFPDSDPASAGADSRRFLLDAVAAVRERGWEIGNVDATVICEAPKIAPHRGRLAASIAAVLGCPVDRVNVKGKTHEKLDAIGEGRAIEVHAVCMLCRR